MEKEIWKDIPGYEGLYQVSSLGNVKSLERYVINRGYNMFVSEKIMKPTGRYLGTRLSKNSIAKSYDIHILVAITFLGHTTENRSVIVDHIDNNKHNNKLSNLHIVSNRYNVSKGVDKTKTTSKYTGVCFRKDVRKWQAHININKKKKHLGYFNTEEEAYEAYKKELETL